MRELRETVDVDTQNRIRQDWLARPEPKELAVTCKGVEALFFVDATTKRCKIKTLDGRIISPNEFEAECGAGNSKAWLQSIVARGGVAQRCVVKLRLRPLLHASDVCHSVLETATTG
jgi:hypothetical protein